MSIESKQGISDKYKNWKKKLGAGIAAVSFLASGASNEAKSNQKAVDHFTNSGFPSVEQGVEVGMPQPSSLREGWQEHTEAVLSNTATNTQETVKADVNAEGNANAQQNISETTTVSYGVDSQATDFVHEKTINETGQQPEYFQTFIATYAQDLLNPANRHLLPAGEQVDQALATLRQQIEDETGAVPKIPAPEIELALGLPPERLTELGKLLEATRKTS